MYAGLATPWPRANDRNSAAAAYAAALHPRAAACMADGGAGGGRRGDGVCRLSPRAPGSGRAARLSIAAACILPLAPECGQRAAAARHAVARAGFHHAGLGSRRCADVLFAPEHGDSDAAASRLQQYGLERTVVAGVHS